MEPEIINNAKITPQQLLRLLEESKRFWSSVISQQHKSSPSSPSSPSNASKDHDFEIAEMTLAAIEAGEEQEQERGREREREKEREKEREREREKGRERKSVPPVILLDVRSFVAYNQGHLEGAINLCIPQTLAKRASFCTRSMEAGISGPLARELFARRRNALVVLYEQKDDVTPLLAKCFQALLKEQICAKVMILEGGFQQFQQEHPEMIRGTKRCGKPACTPLLKPLAPLTAPANLSFTLPSSSASAFFPSSLAPTRDEKQQSSSSSSSSSLPFSSASTLKIPGKDESLVPITDFLFLSGSLIAQDYQCLRQNGIRYIINSAEELENCFSDCGEFLYTRLNLQDHPSQHMCFVKVFENAFSIIDEARRTGARVLVHCRGGRSRSATIVIAYLMKTFRLSFQHAYEYVQSKSPKISPNLGFVGQLIRYESYLKGGEGKVLPPQAPSISPRICREESPRESYPFLRPRNFHLLSSSSSPEICLERNPNLECLWPRTPSPLSSQS